MISYLNIQNIAIIRDLSLELKPGLNILSGETGAGKSIIIDSLNFVLGERADRSLIRYGENSARVEVVFDRLSNENEVKRALEEAGIEYGDGTVIVTRFMNNDRSECRINGRIVTLAILRGVVSMLVDIHSQNEHQSLMKTANHLPLLDAFEPKTELLKAEYHTVLSQYRKINEDLTSFMSEDERARRMDILSFQIEEIERVHWEDAEEENILNATRARYYNAQKISDALHAAANALDGDRFGASEGVRSAMNDLRSVIKFDESLNSLYDRADAVCIELVDIAENLREKLNDSGEYSDISGVEHRLSELKMLRKKYGTSLEDVANFYEEAKKEYEILSDAEARIASLNLQSTECEQKIDHLVRVLHAIRVQLADSFSNAIQNNLQELGMKNSKFAVKIDFSEDDIFSHLNANGADTVEFMLSPNVGEPLKPLAKIASGGEMSRFMLALKNIIAEVDKIGTLIFDEIDTGISGVIAKVVACKLYDVAKSRQVIAITHLAQLASMGDVNYLIEKFVENEKTMTHVSELNGDEVHREIMRLTGAVENSDIGLNSAKELKSWANNYKRATNLK